MKHYLNLTNGQAFLLNSILSIPDQFSKPGTLLRACFLLEKLDLEIPKTEEDLSEWANASFSDNFEITEAQRDLCKESIEKNSLKIPPTKTASALLKQFGFSDE